LANSVITGGRSNFLLIAAAALAALSARRKLRVKQIFSSRRQRRIITIMGGAAVAYVIYVFYARAQASDELVYLYVVNFLPYMGLDFDEWYRVSISQGWMGTGGNMLILVLGYLTHSFATTAAIVGDAPLEHKMMIFNNIAGILYKFGLIEKPDSDWFLLGRFPSVPGALWHQFGLMGFVLISYLLGILGALTSRWAYLRPNRLLPLGAYVLTATTLMLTPFVFAPDLLSFPSIVVAFVILAAVARLRRQLRLLAGTASGTTIFGPSSSGASS
jgi:hypothetical protein